MKFGKFVTTFALALSIGFLSTACKEGVEGETALEIPGVDGPKLHIVEDRLMISAVFENLVVEGGLRYPVPKYPNSHIEVGPDFESDGTLMVVSVAIDDILGADLNQFDPQTLPGGRPLPGVASGTLPAVAFSIPQWKNMGLYLGPKVFGIFAPIKGLNMQGALLTAKFYADGKRQGNVSIVGEDQNGENGGFLLMLNLDSTTKKYLKYLANKY